jgi:hypothetical protein
VGIAEPDVEVEVNIGQDRFIYNLERLSLILFHVLGAVMILKIY